MNTKFQLTSNINDPFNFNKDIFSQKIYNLQNSTKFLKDFYPNWV